MNNEELKKAMEIVNSIEVTTVVDKPFEEKGIKENAITMNGLEEMQKTKKVNNEKKDSLNIAKKYFAKLEKELDQSLEELESIQIKNIYLVTFTQTASGNEASKLYLFNKETIAVSAETVTECRDKIGLMYRTRTLDKHLLTVSLPEDFYLFYKIAEEEADYEELKTIPQPILPKPKDTELLIPNKKVFVEAKKLELIL